VFDIVRAGWISQMVAVVAKLGVADLLGDGPKRVDELAEACGAHQPTLQRLLEALAPAGFFAERADGRFELTPLGRALCAGGPGSVRELAAMCGEPWYVVAWTNLLYSVKTGRSAFEKAHGADLDTFLTVDSEASARFQAATADLAALDGETLSEAYDFAGAESVVGGGLGHGAVLAAVLAAREEVER
jgi:hypothetical protein